MEAGFTMADYPKRLSLRGIANFLHWARKGSAIHREAHGPKADWGNSEELSARTIEVLQWANWQRAGDKTAPKPRPLTRPGEEKATDSTRQHFGDEPMSIAEFHRRWEERTAA